MDSRLEALDVCSWMNYLLFAMVILSGCSQPSANTPAEQCVNKDSANALMCYKQALEREPLRYTLAAEQRDGEVERRTYHLGSQVWSPEPGVTPASWSHDVDLYIPDHSLMARALVVVNNGTRLPLPSDRTAPDFSAEALSKIAKQTRSLVVSISDVPNQRLIYGADGVPRAEDDSVARSWRLFMESPRRRAELPLEIPMAAAVSRAMSLAQRELPTLSLQHFAVTGVSKRAWASWLTAAVDPRVDAVVPFALDFLNTQVVLHHIFKSYGENWPIAFAPYYKEGIDQQLDAPQFGQLAQIIDPLQYFSRVEGKARSMTKYIVNASGDDFFVPDNAIFYYDQIGGEKALRMLPNTSHAGVKSSTTETLVTFMHRYQVGRALPKLQATLHHDNIGDSATVNVVLDEVPQQLRIWSASNVDARDFRYACGVRYAFNSVKIASKSSGAISIPISAPSTGWRAYFAEATMEDGMVVTSPVYILGSRTYPASAPSATGSACRTLPGR
ncbi:PhoPQ-activated pathogenicity-related family protein [Burkholderia cenocepacia]|uniref:PhoPQ-activated pathogenicity-related family protein n=1 Tax=Burkholderia cenocepacia TaxID=95486 RepID=UPI000F59F054|nr:PhoPQ-activated protein PqaA family protein [Burkholderia cenocepacia]RQU48885.1 PhoPQ-regulated protein [Burkholderia cenocepacia]RQV31768.1 PhoPQ-regulated protein [Burkholderia cenocepacia]